MEEKKDFRKVFNSIPEEFDKGRLRYCNEVFEDIIKVSKLDSNKSALEIGPGTGQATEPILKTGCSYLAVELGENLTESMKDKFNTYDNFSIVNDDFVTHDFAHDKFDLIYSAATIQWIPEEKAFPKVYDLLKEGGTLAMMFTLSDDKTFNPALYDKMEETYSKYFYPAQKYNCHFNYENAVNFGFCDLEKREYPKIRKLNADEYITWIRTSCEHITLKEPYKSKFYDGIRNAIMSFGNEIVIKDTIILYLARKRS